MQINSSFKKFALVTLAHTGLMSSCSDKSSAPGTTHTGSLAIAQNFDEMGVSEALGGDVPTSLAGQGEETPPPATPGTLVITLPALTSSERLRSAEACEMRRSAKNGLNILREMAKEICYIEAGAKALKPNGKYRVAYTQANFQGNYSVWIDDSVAKSRRVSFCSDGELRYIFDLEAANGGLAKGKLLRVVNQAVDGGGETWAVQANFDRGVSKVGRTTIDIKGDYTTAWGSSRERLFISYEDKGLAFVAEAKVGKSPQEDGSVENWTTQSAAWLALNLGSVVNTFTTSTEGSSEPADHGAYRSYFDGKGFVLQAQDSEAWKANGPLYAKAKQLPRLPDWEKIAMPADAWDCSGTTDVTPEADPAVYARCDALPLTWAEENCDDEAVYTYTGVEEVIQEADLPQTEAAWEQEINLSVLPPA